MTFGEEQYEMICWIHLVRLSVRLSVDDMVSGA